MIAANAFQASSTTATGAVALHKHPPQEKMVPVIEVLFEVLEARNSGL